MMRAWVRSPALVIGIRYLHGAGRSANARTRPPSPPRAQTIPPYFRILSRLPACLSAVSTRLAVVYPLPTTCRHHDHPASVRAPHPLGNEASTPKKKKEHQTEKRGCATQAPPQPPSRSTTAAPPSPHPHPHPTRWQRRRQKQRTPMKRTGQHRASGCGAAAFPLSQRWRRFWREMGLRGWASGCVRRWPWC